MIYKAENYIEKFVGAVFFTLMFFGLTWCFLIGMDKEAHRQEMHFNSMCSGYGHAMNDHYGKEVCPE
jgi:hypothetical protein